MLKRWCISMRYEMDRYGKLQPADELAQARAARRPDRPKPTQRELTREAMLGLGEVNTPPDDEDSGYDVGNGGELFY